MRARVVILVTAALLAGCGGASGTQAASTPAGTASTTSSDATPIAAPPTCPTAHLRVALGEADGAAGSVYRPLIFNNTGSQACRLRGFPGVSYVAGDDGHQVGSAATMSGTRGGDVLVEPGAAARAMVQFVVVQNYDPAVCRPTPVRGLRVYPPGDTAALFVPLDGATGCAGNPPGPQLSVQTITGS
jgi:hypothetical protein